MKLGVLVPDLTFSQLNYDLLTSGNRWVEESPLNSLTIFTEEPCLPCIQPLFAVMPAAECYAFRGPVTAVNLSTADKLLNMPSPQKKFFFVWDLEWTRMKSKSYRPLANLYRHPSLKLIARSTEHARVISDCWKEPEHIIDGFDVGALAKL